MKTTNHVGMVILILTLIPVVLIGIMDTFFDSSVKEPAIFSVLLISFVGLRTTVGFIEAKHKETPVIDMARRTGLTYQRGNILLGSDGHATGTYRGHSLSLSVSRQLQTRIELIMHKNIGIDLRIRGPYKLGTIGFDRVAGNMFRGTQPYQIGDSQFLIKSQPASLATDLVAPTGVQQGSLRGRLPMIQHRIDIKVEGQKLYVEYTGVIDDANYILCLFDFLSDLAEIIERTTEELPHNSKRLTDNTP